MSFYSRKYYRYASRRKSVLKAELAELASERDLLFKSSQWFKSTKGYCHCKEVYFKITRISESSKYITGKVFLMYPRKGAYTKIAWIHTRTVLRRWKEISELEGSAIEAACEL